MRVRCLPFLTFCGCMLTSASVHFFATTCPVVVGECAGVVVPLVVGVALDVGEAGGSGGAGVGVEELN